MATFNFASLKTFPTYSDPAYSVRQSLQAGSITGNAATQKLVAYANMQAFAVNVVVATAGTSTFSSTISAQTLQLTIISNTSTTTASVALTTATWGPYAIGGPIQSTSTGTGVAGAFVQFPLNTSTGTGGLGGYFVPAGSTFNYLLGADATAVLVPTIDYQLAPLAPVPG